MKVKITESVLREFLESKGVDAEPILKQCFDKSVDLSGFGMFENENIRMWLGTSNSFPDCKRNAYIYIDNKGNKIKWRLIESPINSNDYLLIPERVDS